MFGVRSQNLPSKICATIMLSHIFFKMLLIWKLVKQANYLPRFIMWNMLRCQGWSFNCLAFLYYRILLLYVSCRSHRISWVLFVALDVLILMIQYCFYTLLLVFPPLLLLLSQILAAFCNCLFYQASNLHILNFHFLFFLSCLSSIPEEFVLVSELKEFSTIFLFLMNERFCTGLSRSHVFAQLFFFVITVATRNNIVKWYLHEKANAFFICLRGVQGEGEGSSAVL